MRYDYYNPSDIDYDTLRVAATAVLTPDDTGYDAIVADLADQGHPPDPAEAGGRLGLVWLEGPVHAVLWAGLPHDATAATVGPETGVFRPTRGTAVPVWPDAPHWQPYTPEGTWHGGEAGICAEFAWVFVAEASLSTGQSVVGYHCRRCHHGELQYQNVTANTRAFCAEWAAAHFAQCPGAGAEGLCLPCKAFPPSEPEQLRGEVLDLRRLREGPSRPSSEP